MPGPRSGDEAVATGSCDGKAKLPKSFMKRESTQEAPESPLDVCWLCLGSSVERLASGWQVLQDLLHCCCDNSEHSLLESARPAGSRRSREKEPMGRVAEGRERPEPHRCFGREEAQDPETAELSRPTLALPLLALTFFFNAMKKILKCFNIS